MPGSTALLRRTEEPIRVPDEPSWLLEGNSQDFPQSSAKPATSRHDAALLAKDSARPENQNVIRAADKFIEQRVKSESYVNGVRPRPDTDLHPATQAVGPASALTTPSAEAKTVRSWRSRLGSLVSKVGASVSSLLARPAERPAPQPAAAPANSERPSWFRRHLPTVAKVADVLSAPAERAAEAEYRLGTRRVVASRDFFPSNDGGLRPFVPADRSHFEKVVPVTFRFTRVGYDFSKLPRFASLPDGDRAYLASLRDVFFCLDPRGERGTSIEQEKAELAYLERDLASFERGSAELERRAARIFSLPKDEQASAAARIESERAELAYRRDLVKSKKSVIATRKAEYEVKDEKRGTLGHHSSKLFPDVNRNFLSDYRQAQKIGGDVAVASVYALRNASAAASASRRMDEFPAFHAFRQNWFEILRSLGFPATLPTARFQDFIKCDEIGLKEFESFSPAEKRALFEEMADVIARALGAR